MATGRKARADASAGSSGSADARVEFMDAASHELRSPLTALSGTAQLFHRRLRQQPERRADLADLDKMLYQIERLTNQVDVLLAASHLAQKRFEVIPMECDALAALRRVTTVFDAASRTRTIRLEAPPEHELVVEADHKRLEELLTILLVNALKFSSGDITVRVTQNDATFRVEVADTGIGVPPQDRRRIFEPYVTGSNVDRNYPGLGLYVARAIARRHRGTIGVRAHPGGGSIFWFELPRTQPQARALLARQPSAAAAAERAFGR
ncbi:MAG: sensor histidine kinase [Ktedonobacterales bacterium]